MSLTTAEFLIFNPHELLERTLEGETIAEFDISKNSILLAAPPPKSPQQLAVIIASCTAKFYY